MRGRELKAFVLPQLVEARKREQDEVESPLSTGHSQQLSRSSTFSDSTSPTSPASSARGHSRFPSSNSSLTSSPTMRESIDGYGQAKRPLTDVREEPQDKDEDYEMINGFEGRRSYEEEVPAMTSDAEWGLYRPTAFEVSCAYDLRDDSEFAPNPCAKRRRAEDVPLSPMDGLTSRLGSRMPSFSRSLSRKFKPRKASPTVTMPDRSQEPSMSRANSTRAPSLAGSIIVMEESKSPQLPPTPRRSVVDDRFEDAYLALVNSEKEDAPQQEDEVLDQAKPTTPLLPPIMTQLPSDIREIPYQSPLQSPSVAGPEASSVFNSPLPTPRIAGLPSPPLSSRPSVSSLHPHRGVGPLPSTAEIPPMTISDEDDKWADQLGHANFTILPEPYVAEDTTIVASKQLRADWEVAQSKYMRHLARTGENYGTTSKIYHLTEEKWSEIDATWKRNLDFSFSRIPKLPAGNDAAANNFHTPVDANTPEKPSPLVKVSSADGEIRTQKTEPKFQSFGEGKFPALGDEGIVGPMEVIAPQEPQRRKRKLGFFRWVQGVWPAGAVALGRRSSATH